MQHYAGLYSFQALLLLWVFHPSYAIVCFKDHSNQLGINDFRPMNVDCGPYIRSCLKVVADDGQIIKSCDQASLCPNDGTKVIYHARYYCCQTDLCNSAHGFERGRWPMSILLILVPLLIAIISLIPITTQGSIDYSLRSVKMDSFRHRLAACVGTEKMPVREFLAELIGTFVLVFIGLSANVQQHASAMGNVTSAQIAWGIGFAFAVYLAAPISSADLNPAITLANAVNGDKAGAGLRIIPYWAAQLLGAFLGAGLAYVGHLDDVLKLEAASEWSRAGNGTGAENASLTPIAGMFATYPSEHMTLLGAVADEFIGTAILAGCISLITDKRHRLPSGLVPLLAGLSMMMVAMTYGINTSFAINPARDLGPRLFLLTVGYGWIVFSAHSYYFWVPLAVPMVGALLGTWIYKLFIGVHGLNEELEISGNGTMASASKPHHSGPVGYKVGDVQMFPNNEHKLVYYGARSREST